MRRHVYRTSLTWTGARRDYRIAVPGKPPIEGSADAAFRGDANRWNPEELLVAALSACHQLWFLGLCAAAKIEVTSYQDEAEGSMTEESNGGAGQFTQVTLRPAVSLAPGSDSVKAMALHAQAHDKCFIARSVNFPVRVEPSVTAG